MASRNRRPADVVAAEANSEDYTFTHKGKVYTLKPPSAIKVGVLRRAARSDNELETMFLMLESIADKNALAAIDDMTIAELNEVFAGWQRHGGITVGES